MITICKSLMRKITIRILCVRGFRVPSEARQFLNDEGTQWVSNMFQFLPHILGTHSGCPDCCCFFSASFRTLTPWIQASTTRLLTTMGPNKICVSINNNTSTTPDTNTLTHSHTSRTRTKTRTTSSTQTSSSSSSSSTTSSHQ